MSNNPRKYKPDSKPCKILDHLRCEGVTRNGVFEGQRCRRKKHPGAATCANHGGSGGRPLESGKYSKFGQSLSQKFETAKADADLFNQQKRTALLHGLWEDAFEVLLTAEDGPAELWSILKESYQGLRNAMLAGNAEATKEALRDIERILNNGLRLQRAESKIRELTQEIAAVSKVQHIGTKTASEVLTARELDTFRQRIISEIQSAVGPDGKPLDGSVRKVVAEIFIRAASG